MPEELAPSSVDLDPYIRQQIENLRPRLLDLSRVNPLVSIRFSPRSTSQVRVVDELPDALCFDLTRGKAMRFAALPPLDLGTRPGDDVVHLLPGMEAPPA